MKSLLEFIKYNNAFPIILSVVVFGTGAAFAASPELRQAVFSPARVSAPVGEKEKPTDAKKLLSENLGKFDLDVRIDAVTEDATGYHAAYSYTTLEISGGAWKEVRKNGKMDIPKALLGKRDLKSYLVEQIGQVIDREIVYLSEVQSALKAKNAAEKSKEYASLSGTEIDEAARKEAEKRSVSGSSVDEPSAQSGTKNDAATPGITLTKEEINDMIVKAVSDFLAIDTSMPEDITESPVETVVPDTSAVSDTETIAEEITLESEPVSEP
jgi:hypothetical protein